MIKPVIKIAVLMVAVIGGGVAGSFVKNMSNGDAAGAHAKADKGKTDSHGKSKKDKKAKGHDKKGDHGGESKAGSIEYLKFKRQFVVPVTTDGEIKSLMIMNLNLELNSDAPSNSFSLEPKLRDAFMRDLLLLSNEGVLSGDLTSPETYENIRETLLGSSRRILKQGVNDILILDLAKRDNR